MTVNVELVKTQKDGRTYENIVLYLPDGTPLNLSFRCKFTQLEAGYIKSLIIANQGK